jgi:phosphoribosylaminoimidazole-succinocarboxamide synthase
MVDFNNTTTVTQPRKDVVNFIVLQRLTETIDSIKNYELKKGKNYDSGLPELQADIMALFWTIKDMLKKSIKPEKDEIYKNTQQIEKDIRSEDEEDVYKAFDYLNAFIYSKGITKIDTKEEHDRTDIISMNEEALGNE